MGSGIVQSHKNAAGDGFAWSRIRLDFEELDRVTLIARPEYQVVGFEIEITNDKSRVPTNRIERRPVRPVGNERVVMPVDDYIGVW